MSVWMFHTTVLRWWFLAACGLSLIVSGPALAYDGGIISGQRLNVFLDLPTSETALSPQAALEAAQRHWTAVRDGTLGEVSGPSAAYWRDYRKVVAAYPRLAVARPVLVSCPDDTLRIARWLVGVEMGDEIGGFLAVDPQDGTIQSRCMFTPQLAPLFRVSNARWLAADAVNDLPELAELIPPLTQFTTGIPVDPAAPDVYLIDGVLELPKKTQEERRDAVDAFNRGPGRTAGVRLRHTLGRRTATSKCLAVAASYVADWWIAATGGTLPEYRNAVGGQKEYGINPRHLESLYFERARQDAGIAGRVVMALGNLTGVHAYVRAQFKLVGRDRVTGEPIPYSPRGYARILAETRAGKVRDPLLPDQVVYEHEENPFAMDQSPLLLVIDRNLMARRTRRKDERRHQDADSFFQIADWNASQVTVADKESRLRYALHTWGPLYAQHLQRNAQGEPVSGLRAKGVHACVIVGYTERDGRLHFIYRETFGQAGPRYLEDSFLGPSYRAFPVEFFYQAIAFPHTLQPVVTRRERNGDGSVTGTLHVYTNRGSAFVDPDDIKVMANGKTVAAVTVQRQAAGRYRFFMPAAILKQHPILEIQATKRYFADGEGNTTFATVVVLGDVPAAG